MRNWKLITDLKPRDKIDGGYDEVLEINKLEGLHEFKDGFTSVLLGIPIKTTAVEIVTKAGYRYKYKQNDEIEVF